MNGGRTFSEMLAEINTLKAENARLMEALEKIEELTSPHIGPNQDATTAFMLARAALKGGDGE
jgi:hypothetical protein